MSERTSDGRSRKSRGQDLLGIALCMVGGFAAVSIFLALRGQESKSLLTRPVENLMDLAGAFPALVFTAALAVLGVLLFLRTEALAPGRHVLGLAGATLGLALVLGGVSSGAGGIVGAALPSALGGTAGLLAALVVGLTVLAASTWAAWLGVQWELVAKPPSKAEIGFPNPLPDADGVSAAEALALQSEPDAVSSRPALTPASTRADVRVGGGVPTGTQPLESDHESS